MTRPRKKKDEIIDIKKIRCPTCGHEKLLTDFYKSDSPLYKNNQSRIVFCKECMWETYDRYFKITQDMKISIYISCMKYDVPFSEAEYEGTVKQALKQMDGHHYRIYMTKINSLGNYNNGLIGFDPSVLLNKELNSNNLIIQSEKDSMSVKNIQNIKLSEEDIQVKEDVIRLIGYDPFLGYSNFDQKFLYNELITYLTEEILEDTFILSQIFQIVNNNNQIRKIDLVIANMSNDTKSLIANHTDIKILTQTKNIIVQSTDKIAKENSISVKNRGDKKAGKSTLTYMMKQLREMDFEKAEQDYYTQNRAYGMQLVADISHKSIISQLQFDENDINDMFMNQREMIQSLQKKNEDLEEEIRQLNVQLTKNVQVI